MVHNYYGFLQLTIMLLIFWGGFNFVCRCTRKKECSRGEEKDAWLWSPNQKCVAIQSFDPPSLSCKKTKQVRYDLSLFNT